MYVEKLIGKYFSVVHIHYKIMYRQESWIFQRMHLGNDRLTSSRRNSWKEDILGYSLSWVYRTVLVLLPSLLRELSIFLLLLRGTVGFWKVRCVYQDNVHWQFLLKPNIQWNNVVLSIKYYFYQNSWSSTFNLIETIFPTIHMIFTKNS